MCWALRTDLLSQGKLLHVSPGKESPIPSPSAPSHPPVCLCPFATTTSATLPTTDQGPGELSTLGTSPPACTQHPVGKEWLSDSAIKDGHEIRLASSQNKILLHLSIKGKEEFLCTSDIIPTVVNFWVVDFKNLIFKVVYLFVQRKFLLNNNQ